MAGKPGEEGLALCSLYPPPTPCLGICADSALVSTVLVCVAAECAGCPGLGGVVAQHGWQAVLLRGA